MDIRLALMCGTDIPVPECQLILHQPTMKEISMIGEEDFFIGAQCLNINKSLLIQDEDILFDINNFQIFLTVLKEKEMSSRRESVFKVLSLLMPGYKAVFTPMSLIFSKENAESIIIDENNFEYFQDVIRQILCLNSKQTKGDDFNPVGSKAKEIAEKLKRGRQRIAAERGENEGSMLSSYISSMTIGINSMSLEDIVNLTLFQLLDLVERYSLYMDWDIDIRSRLAGASPDGNPENWMKNIH